MSGEVRAHDGESGRDATGAGRERVAGGRLDLVEVKVAVV